MIAEESSNLDDPTVRFLKIPLTADSRTAECETAENRYQMSVLDIDIRTRYRHPKTDIRHLDVGTGI